MERVSERMREREPEPSVNVYFDKFVHQAEVRQKLATLPRVIDLEKVPRHDGGRTGILGYQPLLGNLFETPIFTMTCMMQEYPPQAPRRLAHRHVDQALFYITKGKGYEFQIMEAKEYSRENGVEYPFEAGDVFAIPQYVIHQHYGDPEVGGQAFVIITRMNQFLGIRFREQHDWGEKPPELPEGWEALYDQNHRLEGYRHKGGLEARLGSDEKLQNIMKSRQSFTHFAGKPKNYYDEQMKELVELNKFYAETPHVIKGKELPWVETRQGRIKYLITPKSNFPAKNHIAYEQKISPGGRSGKHRHVAEEIHLILEGEGYDIHDGIRYDWKAGDLVLIPVFTTHQHFNSSSQHPVWFYAVQPQFYDWVGWGGVEHFEDARP